MSSLNRPAAPGDGRSYWRSLDELADSPDFRRFVENEFPACADEMLAPASRRGFLKIMGASLALAGMTACRWPSEEILPFTQRPEGYVPGEPMFFATSSEVGGVASGLLVTSYDGRPIKIEGNPMHPASMGATHAFAQASVLELYDPDRSRAPVERRDGSEAVRSWEELEQFLEAGFGPLRGTGRGLRVLSESSGSPSLLAMRDRFLRAFPEARWYEYEAISRDRAREGARIAFGAPYRTQLRLDRADVIFSLDEDLLVGHPASVRYARDFVAGRKPARESINRLYVVEAGYSATGAMADARIPAIPSAIPVAAACLAARLVLDHGLRLPSRATGLGAVLESTRGEALYESATVQAAASDLAAHRGRGLIVTGTRQPPEVHALAHVLNEALGNTGRTVEYTSEPDPDRPSHDEAVRALADEIDSGAVGTLLLLGGNPAYDGPADLALGERIERVATSVHLSLYRNETSRRSTWHVPRAHFLESWGDARDWEGRVGIAQPLIEPLFGGKSVVELLAMVLGTSRRDGRSIVRETFGTWSPQGDSDTAWRRAIHDGVAKDSAWKAATPALRATGLGERLAGLLDAGRAVGDKLEVEFVASPAVLDGRFANNGWLQELPQPLTKLTWDNAALVGPSTARRLGVGTGDVVRLEADGRAAEVPVFVMPGQAAGSISLHLGYGRRHAGRVGDGVGFDVYPLRGSGNPHHASVRLQPVGSTHRLVSTQDHHALDLRGAAETERRARDAARELDFSAFHGSSAVGEPHDGDDGGHGGGTHEVNLWKQWEYDGHKWGMAIDLNSCVGCNACVVACQAENNIPIVGKEETAKGRAMHWIRVDRYFLGDPEAPDVVMQPLTCHHCENAPCEQVCPVAATVHDEEGLNVMVYNRCVGTRYCMNNCPYKVRRFNYFNNRKDDTQLEMMAYNPEVTVRSRGVMEKCTFCLQRISRSKIRAKNERRPLEDGEITPACAQACPTRAIVFGDLNNRGSQVRETFEDPRAYALLDWLYVKPRTRYLTRLRNRPAGTDPATES